VAQASFKTAPSRLISLTLVLVILCVRPAAASDIPAGLAGYKSHVAPFFNTYCVSCHGPEKNKGDITVHALNGDLSMGQELEQWEQILDMLEFGEMPPFDAAQPAKADADAVKEWIESGMRAYVKKASAVAAEPQTRRLTNVEYQNTLRDLLGFELDIIDDLPEDPEHRYHFNNTAELMRIGPEQLDRYLEVARKAMRAAIVNPDTPKVFKVRRAWEPDGNDKGMASDEVSVWGNRRGTASEGFSFHSPREHGEYRVRISASAILPEGFDEAPLEIQMGAAREHTQTPYKVVGTLHLTNSPDNPEVFEFIGRMENHPSAAKLVGKPPNARLVEQMSLRPEVIFDDGTLNDDYNYFHNYRKLVLPRVVINWIELETPVVDVWPPEHHTNILFESPLREADEQAYTRQVIERFMSRAYRRPATEAEVDKFVRIFNLIHSGVDTYEHAVRETLAMMLISPQFLYHAESNPDMDNHYAIASKLSYFIWASMPDRPLLELAAHRQLDDPEVIEQQALRMLADEKSNAFVENFTLQWLNLRKMLTVPINSDLFPRFLYLRTAGETAGTEMPYRPTVRDYMMKETVGFIGELIRQNAGALGIVDSDFAVLNERLAAFYGIEDVKGEKMRVVAIKPEDNIGGLLTHGSVLIGNGTGTAPHPIYRAVWLREAILGDTVAPPPSEVPALEETAGESTDGALSIAEALKKHRTVESCNDCHFRLDPWGIPFEEYNAIGRYQPMVPKDGTRVDKFSGKKHGDLAGYRQYLDKISTVEVMAKARVPHGPEIDGMRELKSYLLEERGDDIAENVIRRLLSYGLGRELTYRDRFAVDDLFEELEDDGFRMRDIIVRICQSELFRDTHQAKED
jgi:mono/diheme cytochrome c family protein